MDEIYKLNEEKKQYRKYRNISLTFSTIVIMYVVMFYVFIPTNVLPLVMYRSVQVLNTLSVAFAAAFWLAMMKWKDKLDWREAGMEGGEEDEG